MDLENVKLCWDRLGRIRPVGSMLPAGTHQIVTIDELFTLGKAEIDDVMERVRSFGTQVRYGKALDFGCGLGRSTQALANYFDLVYGVDIAPSMIELAERNNSHKDRCKYLVNQTADLKIFDDHTIDFIWCYGVLNLVEPCHFIAYIKEFFRVLTPGGLIVFQQTDKPGATVKGLILRAMPKLVLNLYHRKRYGFEVHGMKREHVEDLIREAGGTVLLVSQDLTTPGPNWISFRYFARPTQEPLLETHTW